MPSTFQTIRNRLQEGPITHWLAWEVLPLFTRIKTLGWGGGVAHGRGPHRD